MKAMFTVFHHGYQRDGKVKHEAGLPLILDLERKDSLEVAIRPSEVGKKLILKKSDHEGIDIEMELRPAKDFEDRVSKAYNEFEDRLISLTITSIRAGWTVSGVKRSDYVKALKEVEEKYKIEQGDPDYLEWFLTLIGRSPRILADEEAGE